MAKPLKISENNAPLSCKQHDDNIDALLNRANHTGEIPDYDVAFNEETFSDYIRSLDSVDTIATDLNDLSLKYDVLSASIVPNGNIEASIQNLDRKIEDELVPINSTLLTIATDLDLVEVDPITQQNRFLTLNELNARVISSSNRRELTRQKLDELENRLGNFITQNSATISNNSSALSNLLNPTTGSFTLLQQYVNGDVKTNVNKVPGLVTTSNQNRSDVSSIIANIGGLNRVNNKTINDNLQDLLAKDIVLEGKTSTNETEIQDLYTLLGNVNLLQSNTVIYDISTLRQQVDTLTTTSTTNTNDVTGLKTDLNLLESSFEQVDGYLKLSSSGRVVTIKGGPYKRANGSRGFFSQAQVTIPSGESGYLYLVEDGNSAQAEFHNELINEPSAILLGTVNSPNVNTVQLFDAKDAPLSGFSRPDNIRSFGGRAESGFTSSGVNGVTGGVKYLSSLNIPGGTKLTVKGGVKLIVKGNVIINGTLEALPVTQGGPSIEKSINSGGYAGNEAGGGLSWTRSTYHWTTLPAGTGGKSGISGTNAGNSFRARVPRGGSGGGSIIIEAGGKIEVNGNILANGENGSSGTILSASSISGGVSGSGGGAGGAVVLMSSTSVTLGETCQIKTNGGNGGDSLQTGGYKINGAGGGGAGWITIISPVINEDGRATLECEGGDPGQNGDGNTLVLNPAQGAGIGGAFGGLGGNGSAFDNTRNAGDNAIEYLIQYPAS